MTTLVFPSLPGQSWSVHKRPTFSTRVVSHTSGREARTPNYAYPLYEFELSFEGLASTHDFPGVGVNSLQSLLGLYLQCQGQFGTFLYTDPSDNYAIGQALGIGDGTAVTFPFVRTLGGFTEPVGWVLTVQNIYLNGAPQTSGWTIAAPNALAFSTPPLPNVNITADFTFAYECRFVDDETDFENFMAGLWQVQSLKFRSVKP
ncbi:conserved hypothetical protein, putative phage associated protein [Methylocella silvestris BL2]|uniref:DUF2460 domain-containing protein n=1 Tax=Methylocella silvestris (strain DSM 15510 / CIP 108128 / LMG 27833 / NCIMB 13906 / BL2) TaxID=395965 RepID=B8EKT7_METSB|nr:DUF2460 domain-containing protein [Methylocella silvestris]ACK51965.1 conserved hypothetical protein, putative phage associated protein [Methylocella silvestris BL2]